MGNINPVLRTGALKLIAEKKNVCGQATSKRIFLSVFSIALDIIQMGLPTACGCNIHSHAKACFDIIYTQAR